MVEPSDVLSVDVPSGGGRFSIASRIRSFTFAWRGLRWLVQEEHNARLHLVTSLGVVALGAFLKVSANDWRWLCVAIALVWFAEAFNTAIEELCDRIEPEFDSAIGRIKDIAAGGVLIASIAAAMLGLLTLGPPILAVLGLEP